VTGATISGTATWTGQTFSGLGLIPGTYTWTWGSGPSADRLVLQVGAIAASQPVPAISDWGLIIVSSAIALLGLTVGRKRRG